jgi:hypothetical protein
MNDTKLFLKDGSDAEQQLPVNGELSTLGSNDYEYDLRSQFTAESVKSIL